MKIAKPSFREPYMLCLWGIAVPMMTAPQEWFTGHFPASAKI